MMTPSSTLAMVRTLCGCDTSNYPDATGIDHYNYIYQDLTSAIISEIDEDYYFDVATADIVAGQSEYTIDALGLTGNRINEINNVYVKYSDEQEFGTKLRRVNPTELEFDPEWYQTNWSVYDPFFFIQDTSIFIYPASENNVNNGIKITCIYQPADLTISSSASDIELPPRFHKVIMHGVIPLCYQSTQRLQEANNYYPIREKEKKKMINYLKNRNQTTIQILPND